MVSRNIETTHTDAIHDVKIDPSGRLIASGSSDATVRITDAQENRVVDVLYGHTGPVWSVSWAPPAFPGMLASGSYCGKVVVWKHDRATSKLAKFFEYQHGSSVNCVCWSPGETKLLNLAVACSDGVVVLLRQRADNKTQFDAEKIVGAHGVACYAVSWSPDGNDLVSAGFDNQVKIWKYENEAWTTDMVLSGHAGWVRDVQWNPVVNELIASCSDDGTARVWELSPAAKNTWTHKILDLGDRGKPWHVSWSLCGTILAVSCGHGSIVLFKKATDGSGEWVQVPKSGKLDDNVTGQPSGEAVAQLGAGDVY